MKAYKEPTITDEVIELEDIIAISSGGENGSGNSKSINDLVWGEEE